MTHYEEFGVTRGDTTGLITLSADGKTITGDVSPDQWVIHGALVDDTRHQLDLCLARHERNGWHVDTREMR